MTKDSNLPHQTDYDIGYKKPPVKTQFKKGRSGNPKGRPKGARNRISSKLDKFRDIVLQEASRLVPINENGKTIKIPASTAFVRSLSLQAMQARTVGSMKLYSDLLISAEADRTKAMELETAKQLTVLSDAYEYREKMKEQLFLEKQGRIRLPERPLPHPDNVVIDEGNMRVEIRGPYNDMTKNIWQRQMKLKKNTEEELALLHEDLIKPEEAGNVDFIEEQIEREMKHLNDIDLKLMVLWKMLPKQLSDDPDRQDELVELLELHYFEAGEDMPWWFMFYL